MGQYDTIEPVSYTHLDVYKRQVYDRTSLTDMEEVISRIGDAEIVYTNKTPLPREVLERCPNLRFIGVLATGYNVVDVKAAKERDIVVCNIPSYGTDAVAVSYTHLDVYKRQDAGLRAEDIKIMIEEIVDGEDSRKPFSDQRLTDLLKARNVNISRRAVAKYREELGIPSSVDRKDR